MSTGGVDFGDGSRSELVDQLAEDGSVLKNVFVGLAWGEFGSQDSFDPFLGFGVLGWVTLGSELQRY